MAVTITQQTQISPGVWQVSWTSDLPSPLYRIYQNGLFTRAQNASTAQFQVTAGAQLLVEILDDPAASPTFVYPGVVTLQWYAVPETASYRIEQYTGGQWVTRENLPENGSWIYEWVSPFLPDATDYQFRVTPIGSNGNAGDSLTFSGLIVRVPDNPLVSYAYNAQTGLVTVQ